MTLSVSCLLFLLFSQPWNKLILIRFWGGKVHKGGKGLLNQEKNRGEKNWSSKKWGLQKWGLQKNCLRRFTSLHGTLLHYHCWSGRVDRIIFFQSLDKRIPQFIDKRIPRFMAQISYVTRFCAHSRRDRCLYFSSVVLPFSLAISNQICHD